jgi:hypothetical protein
LPGTYFLAYVAHLSTALVYNVRLQPFLLVFLKKLQSIGKNERSSLFSSLSVTKEKEFDDI